MARGRDVPARPVERRAAKTPRRQERGWIGDAEYAYGAERRLPDRLVFRLRKQPLLAASRLRGSPSRSLQPWGEGSRGGSSGGPAAPAGRVGQLAAEHLDEGRARPLFGAHGDGVRRRHLRVDQREPPAADALGQVHERDLRRVRLPREHRLPEEEAPERHAVEASGELAVLPRLDRVRVAHRVQDEIRLRHLLGDPRAVLPGARRLLAGADHALEGRVVADVVGAVGHDAPERAPHVDAIDPQDAARIRRVPEDRQRLVVPGEDPRSVGEQEPLGREIAADREQPVLGLVERREHERAPERADRHQARPRSRSTRIAALWPAQPMTLPAGCVPALTL